MLDIWLVRTSIWTWRVEAETQDEAIKIIKDSGYFCGPTMRELFKFKAQRAAYDMESDRLAIVLAEPADVAALEGGLDASAATVQVMQGSAA